MLGLVGVVVAIAAGNSGSSSSTITTPDPAPSASAVSATPDVASGTSDGSGAADAAGADASGSTSTAPPPLRAQVGDSLTISGQGDKLRVRVLGVRDPVQGGEFDQPGNGNRFVGLLLSLKNIGTHSYSDAPGNGATLVLNNDRQADTTLLSDGECGGSFQADLKLAPGEVRQGCIPFEIPQGASLKTFEFTLASGFGDETGKWELG
jgi:hypothetical protein